MNTDAIRQTIPVVILCGGTGTRMREETEFKPKPMVEIGGKPILWHIMKGYAHHGYKDFILCLGYKGSQIKDYFISHQLQHNDFHLDLSTNITTYLNTVGRDDFRITFADTGSDILTGERLLRVAKYIRADEFMLTYGDGVSDVNMNALRDFHDTKRAEHHVVGTVTGIHPKSKYGLVNHNEHHVVTDFRQKPLLSDFTNGGFMVLNRDFLPYCKPNQMIEDALIDATRDGKIAMYPHEGFWHCMDTYKDKEDLEKLWQAEPKWKVWA